MIAYYICQACEVEGSDPEPEPNVVYCWRCGKPADIVTRMLS
jgi:hypothetical protein